MFLRAKKSLGQHFLTNSYVVSDIADAAELTPGETVLEIGPGTGMLTRELLERKARVIAVEADARAVDILKQTFASYIGSGFLKLIHDDIRTVSLPTLGLTAGSYKVVANIPYYISGMLFEKLLGGDTEPTTLVFLVQKEVAERIARSKKESLLSLSVKAYGVPRYVGTVSRGNFRPVPGVDSAILAVSNVSKRSFSTLDEAFFFTVLKTAFRARRKQLVGNLTAILPREDILDIMNALGIDPHSRGEDLPIDTWLALARRIEERLSTRGK